MTLVRYEPWNVLQQFRKEMDRLFDTDTNNGNSSVVTSDWSPAVDVKESDDAFTIIADIPGVDPKDIEINMEDGILTIKGQRESEKKEEADGYKRVERSYGSFYRRFSLPDSANPDKINAKSKNGVVEITIAKHEKVQPRKIAVQH
ncbi:MAG: Hsp20/alpha crystallin family protein [Gammaproteobacteria bacterium]|nr:Hsp20/alpha crystallin family protein [Gammaproteobacteria bacterium]